jgi:hypothetical protein
LGEDDALGQVYQALNAPALQAAYRDAKRARRKFRDDEYPDRHAALHAAMGG